MGVVTVVCGVAAVAVAIVRAIPPRNNRQLQFNTIEPTEVSVRINIFSACDCSFAIRATTSVSWFMYALTSVSGFTHLCLYDHQLLVSGKYWNIYFPLKSEYSAISKNLSPYFPFTTRRTSYCNGQSFWPRCCRKNVRLAKELQHILAETRHE